MTTNKTRCTIYLSSTRQVDDLVEAARRALPLEARGRVTRSTCCEAAVRLALEDLRRDGAQSALLKALVTLPAPKTGD